MHPWFRCIEHDRPRVTAFTYGSGFLTARASETLAHPYVSPVPFALKAGPRQRAVGADSARYGAVSAAIAAGELYLLFGGRPVRKAHPEEPTVLIDVYGIDGGYRRSYRLPVDALSMDTDGETFYVTTVTEAGFPLMLGLQPEET